MILSIAYSRYLSTATPIATGTASPSPATMAMS
jgi:hypothetical protein